MMLLAFPVHLKGKKSAACPPAPGRNRLTKSPRNSATAGFILGIVVILSSGVPALAFGEPAQAVTDAPDYSKVIASFATLALFFTSGVGVFLIKAVLALKGGVREMISDGIADDKTADAARKLPLITSRDNPPVGSREFAAHRERNTAAHNEAFGKIRDLEDKLRGEYAAAHAAVGEKLEGEIRALRDADNHNSEKLSGEISRLVMLVGELRGSVESLARREKIHR